MNNVDIVLDKLSRINISPLHFNVSKLQYPWWMENHYKRELRELVYKVQKLKEIKYIHSRVYQIISLCENYNTYHPNNRFQCNAGRNRSALDIYRIYKYYFDDDIFGVLRALYKITAEKRDISTHRCSDVRKQVFFIDRCPPIIREIDENSGLGVTMRNWENIGLGE